MAGMSQVSLPSSLLARLTFAIVPAAGRSVRMGTGKLLLPWRGRPLIDHLLDAWRSSRVGRVVVVARADDDALLAHLRGHDVDLVVPATAPPEMKDSVCAALDHIRDRYRPKPLDVWLLAPADLPQLSSRVIDQVLAAAATGGGAIIVPRSGERRGHPVAFPWSLHEAVLTLGPDQGVNSLLDERFPTLYIETAEPAGGDDIDRPDDFQRLQTLDPPADR
jgi:molybdenum cofactor cytidylyltransferase